MRFEELEKLEIKEWDGEPILCYVGKGLTNEITPDSIEITKVVSFNAEAQHPWGDNRGRAYHSAYPVHPNEKSVTELNSLRMTNRQLSMWLAKGNGERSGDRLINSYQHHAYDKNEANKFVANNILVRKWGSEEWIEPTTDLLED